jgi:hypothetical protein
MGQFPQVRQLVWPYQSEQLRTTLLGYSADTYQTPWNMISYITVHVRSYHLLWFTVLLTTTVLRDLYLDWLTKHDRPIMGYRADRRGTRLIFSNISKGISQRIECHLKKLSVLGIDCQSFPVAAIVGFWDRSDGRAFEKLAHLPVPVLVTDGRMLICVDNILKWAPVRRREVIRWREYVTTINDNAKSSKQYRDNTLVK